MRIVIYHPDHPLFSPECPAERPVDDISLRCVLKKYTLLDILDLVVDLETPRRSYNDYTASEGVNRYHPREVELEPLLSNPIDQPSYDAALKQLLDDLDLKLKSKLQPSLYVPLFLMHAVTLFPNITLRMNMSMESSQGKGSVDMAIIPTGLEYPILGFVTIYDEFRTARTKNMVQLESTMDDQRNRKRKFDDNDDNDTNTTSKDQCGILTDGIQWYFVHYAHASHRQFLPDYRIARIPGGFTYDTKRWRKDAQKVFSHIVQSMKELSKGLLERKEELSQQNKRRCQ